MERRECIFLIGTAAFWSVAALAQSKAPPQIAIVGSLGQGALDSFNDGLREFGLIDKKTVILVGGPGIVARNALAKQISDAIAKNVDLIFASGALAGSLAKDATSTIPIVCITGDLVAAGLVNSLSKPGGNITGICNLTAEASAKRLELLKELDPALSRVAVFFNPDDATSPLSVKPLKAAAAKLRLGLELIGVRTERDFEAGIALAVQTKSQAIALTSNPLFDVGGKQIAAFAVENKLATMSFADSFPKVGGLVSYGPHIRAAYRRSAFLVSRILNGTSPAELPVEQPTRFNLVINLRTAKALGLKVPDILLTSADEVIE